MAGPARDGRRGGWRIPLAVAAVVAVWIAITLIGGRLLPAGSDAPDFSLPRVGGGELALADLRGKVVVLDFWSIGCPPCLEELPRLGSLHRRMERYGVVVVGVGAGGESLDETERFARERGIEYRLVVDESGAVSRIYRVSSLPTIYIIARDGTVAATHAGTWSDRGLFGAVEAVLRDGG